MLKRLYKKSYDVFVKPLLKLYLKKERLFVYKNIRLKIYPGVFHPGLFFSTGIFLEFIENLDLKNKRFCEVGAGSGLLSFVAYSQGAEVSCFEINPKAVAGLTKNFKTNFKTTNVFNIYQSDLFDSVPKSVFDIIVINPPFFFKDATSAEAKAWYCGANGEYFLKLFRQLQSYSNALTKIYMILAENCDIHRVRHIAEIHNYKMDVIFQKRKKWETNFIFEINTRQPTSEI
jgi:release factor glutamine methyltransferase